MSFLLPAAINAGASIIGGVLSRPRKQKETSGQKRSKQIVDDLLASMRGEGPYSNLFQTDDAAFQKSFVDPAKSMFQNQIAPQIQQSYIAGGQQRGTGLDDQLLRAGVDLDQILNQQYMNFQQQGQNRQFNALNQILGMQGGAAPGMGMGEAAGRGLSGFLQSPGFTDLIQQGFPQQNTLGQQQNSLNVLTPKGFQQQYGGG